MKIIAGKFGVQGVVDGNALDMALLKSPATATSNNTTFYFSETGNPVTIRSYDGTRISTVHKGAPIRTISGMCVGDKGSLLICDNLASKIWSLDITSGTVVVCISIEDMPPCPPCGLSISGKETFSPNGILRVVDGSILFTDAGRNQVFRYLDADRASASSQEMSMAMNNFNISVENSIATLKELVPCMHNLVRESVHTTKGIEEIYRKVHNDNYIKESNALAQYISGGYFEITSFAAMIIEAPSLIALAHLLENVPWETNDSLRALCKENVSNYLVAVDISHPLRDQALELKSLLRILRKVDCILSLQDVICSILNPDRYVA